MTISSTDEMWMDRAIALAEKTRPSPNPRVGCVIVHGTDQKQYSEGYHTAAGMDHAEVSALKNCRFSTENSTVYVTLEPCNHHGRTPPCTEALIAAKAKRVVIGSRDPNPNVTGGGIDRLRNAGIVVDVGVREQQCRTLIRAWSHFVTKARPYTIIKAAASMDGKIATHTGDSRWISNEHSRHDAHRLRAQSDAILVGVNTVVLDDPQLTVRSVESTAKPPVRVVLDSAGRTPLHAKIVQTAKEIPTWIFHTPAAERASIHALQSQGVTTIEVPQNREGHADIRSVISYLGEHGIVQLLVEGGSIIHGSFLAEKAANAFVCYFAPLVIGGAQAPSIFGGKGAATMKEASNLYGLHNVQVTAIEDNYKLTAEWNF